MKKNFIFDSTVPYFVKGWWQNFGDNTLIMPAVVIALINRLSEGKDFLATTPGKHQLLGFSFQKISYRRVLLLKILG
jgi:hypothetical protein